MITSDNLQQRDVTFKPGDTVRVHYRVIEGNRERVQVFEGLCISRKGSGIHETFTVRKNSFGVNGEDLPAPLSEDRQDRSRLARRCETREALLYPRQGGQESQGQEGQISQHRRCQGPPNGLPQEECSLYAFDAAWVLCRRGPLAGADEAGRGALAGPLVAAAVVLGGDEISGINDSKLLRPALRQEIFGALLRRAEAVSVVAYPAWWIDRHGVGLANREALRRALASLESRAGCGLADGNLALGPEVECLPRADARSAAVAAGGWPKSSVTTRCAPSPRRTPATGSDAIAGTARPSTGSHSPNWVPAGSTVSATPGSETERQIPRGMG